MEELRLLLSELVTDKLVQIIISNPENKEKYRKMKEKNFPGKQVYVVGDVSKRFTFMEDSVMDEIPDEYYQGALAIILDTSAKALISDDRYSLAEKTLRIDHHIFCEKIADVEITDTSFESCCGMIAEA